MSEYLPLLLLSTSLIPGIIIFFIKEESFGARTIWNIGGALAKLGLIIFMLFWVDKGVGFEFRTEMIFGIDFVLKADPLALLFGTLSSVLWLFTTIYAIGYLEDSPNRSRFFGFFSLCVMSTVGIAMSGNLFTFFIFYELLTLATYPLVIHRQSEESIKAGNIYLLYTVSGGALLLVAIAWLYSITGSLDFREGGYLAPYILSHSLELTIIFFMFIASFGVKAAIFPLHGWLPKAMVAPAPVSALLHAVAVVKAGAFGIVRTVYEVFGIESAYALWLLYPLAILAAATILFGSIMAIFQDDLKRRLAYSTVSQVSYIILGVAIFGPLGTIGGLVHLVHQGVMKITLFFCAGLFAETLGVSKVSQMDGLGRRMPLSSVAFSIGAIGMIGVPPVAGFITKWYLGLGAINAGMEWIIAVLLLSSLLNAAYFLPILYRLWFKPHVEHNGKIIRTKRGWESSRALLFPTLITAFFSVVLGLFASSDISALYWVKLITDLEYR